MRSVIVIALMFVVFTARDEQSGDCLRKGTCKDVRVEQHLGSGV